jgi:CRISPR system Cascade subunit CasD
MDRPGHSLLVGLIAAALGIRREEEARLEDLSRSCQFAVRSDAPGLPLIDYHTVQTAKQRRGFAPRTRRQLLAEADRVTAITYCDYRTGVRFTVSLRVSNTSLTHEQIVAALRHPCFSLYLGRKSCPLALPLNAVIVDAADVPQSFAIYDRETENNASRHWPVGATNPTITADASLFPGDTPGRRERRRTRPLARRTWQFALLDELVLTDARDESDEA